MYMELGNINFFNLNKRKRDLMWIMGVRRIVGSGYMMI